TNCWALVTQNAFCPILTFPDGEKCSVYDWYEQVGPVYRRPPEGGEINKITVVQHLGRLEDVAFRPVSREQVEKVWPGCPYCKEDGEGYVKKFGAYSIQNGELAT